MSEAKPRRPRAHEPHWIVKRLAAPMQVDAGHPPRMFWMHRTGDAAIAEAQRLAEKHPGIRFVVYAMCASSAAHILTEACYGGSKAAGWHNDLATGLPRTPEQNDAMFPIRIAADALEMPPQDLGLDEPITEAWLKESGFRWSQHHRQTSKHWLLWLGDAVREREGFNLTSYEDIGIELAPGYNDPKWFCWFRSDAGGLYGRFLHVRHVRLKLDVVRLVEAITGYPWTPEYHVGGFARGPLGYKNMLDYARRKDVELLVEPNRAWHDIERDPYRAGASAPTIKELVDREAGKIP